MERAFLGSDLSLSRIAYGLWRVCDDPDTSPAHVQAKIEACLDQGITTLDQADIYGGYGAEAVLGACLRQAPHLRDRLEIVTKCDIVAPVGRHRAVRVKHYDTSAAHIRASVETSLRDMAIDRIDLLLIHRPDPMMDAAETGAALDQLIASGKIRAAGVSNFRPWDFDLLQSAMQNALVTNQIELSLSCHRSFTNGDLSHLQTKRVRPMAWSPLARGTLLSSASKPLRDALNAHALANGTDAAAVAIAWLLAHPAGIIPIMGTNSIDRIRHLSDATQVAIDRQSWFELYSHALGHEVP